MARQEDGLDDATIFTGTDAGTVYAVDAMNGKTLWTTSVGSTVGAEPALADGSLYVPAGDGLSVLDAATGDIEWEGSLDGLPTHFQPAVAGGVVFVATDDWVRAFDASGCGEAACEPLWSGLVGDINGAPAISKGQLYIPTQWSRLVAYGLPE